MKGKKELHPSSTKNFRTPAILFWLAVSFPLFVCLSVCLIVCQSVCLYLFVCCQSVSLPLSVYLFLPLSLSQSLSYSYSLSYTRNFHDTHTITETLLGNIPLLSNLTCAFSVSQLIQCCRQCVRTSVKEHLPNVRF